MTEGPPRITSDGRVGQVDATVVPRFAGPADLRPAAAARRGVRRRRRGPRRPVRRRASATGPAHGSARRTSGSPPGCCGPTTRPRTSSRSPRSRWPTPATWRSTRSTSRRPIGQIEAGRRTRCSSGPAGCSPSAATTRSRCRCCARVPRRHGPVAVVHFDAHLDTWDTYFGAPYTHGTPFRRAVRGGAARPDGVPARRHPRAAVRRPGPRRRRRPRLRRSCQRRDATTSASRGVVERIRGPGRATGRSTSRSTSTCSTPRSRRAPARPRPAG